MLPDSMGQILIAFRLGSPLVSTSSLSSHHDQTAPIGFNPVPPQPAGAAILHRGFGRLFVGSIEKRQSSAGVAAKLSVADSGSLICANWPFVTDDQIAV